MHPSLQCLLAVLTGWVMLISLVEGVAHDLPPQRPAAAAVEVAHVPVINLRDLDGRADAVAALVLTAGAPAGPPVTRLWEAWQAGKAAVSFSPLISDAAARTGLPYDFLYRLLRQESGLRADAVSPKGALGIAQFMPATALERGLTDPFDPSQAVIKAAELLRDHSARFGNLGLAAAAYNAGPGRVERWLSGASGMPQETRDYVRIVTGRVVEEWAPAGRWASLGRDAGVAATAVPARVVLPLFAAMPAVRIGAGIRTSPPTKTTAATRRPERIARSEDELCASIGQGENRCLVRQTY